ncbi:MAG: ABC transporter ATP-binding protein [Candidatus Eisenbacteria bacterium]|nr:ABC transporter ATP-binding protein [Candidatus Eisenbacteria bacterium]
MKVKTTECCLTGAETSIAELRNASKVFRSGSTQIVALQKTSLEVKKGELLLIVGPSGSGKTTLLSLLGCVLYPTEGCVCVKGVNTRDLDDAQLASLRLHEIGFVFQNFNLISPLTAGENIRVPLALRGLPRAEQQAAAARALSMVGLSQRRSSLPRQLSGGEQQRVAIARALVTDPSIILCDEPTASLDAGSIEGIMRELRRLADVGKAVAVVTHDPRLETTADRVIRLENGAVIEERRIR